MITRDDDDRASRRYTVAYSISLLAHVFLLALFAAHVLLPADGSRSAPVDETVAVSADAATTITSIAPQTPPPVASLAPRTTPLPQTPPPQTPPPATPQPRIVRNVAVRPRVVRAAPHRAELAKIVAHADPQAQRITLIAPEITAPPSAQPSPAPTEPPATPQPTQKPQIATPAPSTPPTLAPTAPPTPVPTEPPTAPPTIAPTLPPQTPQPTALPAPTVVPTRAPTAAPTIVTIARPTAAPQTAAPQTAAPQTPAPTALAQHSTSAPTSAASALAATRSTNQSATTRTSVAQSPAADPLKGDGSSAAPNANASGTAGTRSGGAAPGSAPVSAPEGEGPAPVASGAVAYVPNRGSSGNPAADRLNSKLNGMLPSGAPVAYSHKEYVNDIGAAIAQARAAAFASVAPPQSVLDRALYIVRQDGLLDGPSIVYVIKKQHIFGFLICTGWKIEYPRGGGPPQGGYTIGSCGGQQFDPSGGLPTLPPKAPSPLPS